MVAIRLAASMAMADCVSSRLLALFGRPGTSNALSLSLGNFMLLAAFCKSILANRRGLLYKRTLFTRLSICTLVCAYG